MEKPNPAPRSLPVTGDEIMDKWIRLILGIANINDRPRHYGLQYLYSAHDMYKEGEEAINQTPRALEIAEEKYQTLQKHVLVYLDPTLGDMRRKFAKECDIKDLETMEIIDGLEQQLKREAASLEAKYIETLGEMSATRDTIKKAC